MSEAALDAFFDILCTSLNKPRENSLNANAIIEKANRIHLLTAEEAKWQMEGKLYLNIAPTVDDKNVIIEWMKEAKILQEIDLKWNKNLNSLNFQDANLFRANLGGCELRHARFWEANLEEAILGSAHLEGANLSHATLTGTHLEAANLTGATLTGTKLGGTHFLDEYTTLPDGKMYRDRDKRNEVLKQCGALL